MNRSHHGLVAGLAVMMLAGCAGIQRKPLNWTPADVEDHLQRATAQDVKENACHFRTLPVAPADAGREKTIDCRITLTEKTTFAATDYQLGASLWILGDVRERREIVLQRREPYFHPQFGLAKVFTTVECPKGHASAWLEPQYGGPAVVCDPGTP